jgi:hypothetical protein
MSEQGFEQTQQPVNPDSQRDPIKGAEQALQDGGILVNTDGGLITKNNDPSGINPEGIIYNADGSVASSNQSREEGGVQEFEGEGGEQVIDEIPPAERTLEQRIDFSNMSMDNLKEVSPDLMKAESSEEAIEAAGEDAFQSASTIDDETLVEIEREAKRDILEVAHEKNETIDDEEMKRRIAVEVQKKEEEARVKGEEARTAAEEKSRSLLDRAATIAGITFDDFREANEGASMEKFIDLFLVFGVEGKFGAGVSEYNEALSTDGDKILRDKIEGNPERFVEAMSESLYYNLRQEGGTVPDFLNLSTQETAQDPQILYKSVKYFNQIAAHPRGWQSLQKGLSKFCEGDYEFGLETQKLFNSLESISAIRKFLDIASVEDSGDSDDSDGSDNQASQPVPEDATS